MNKKLEILKQMMHTADAVTAAAKKMPRTGKRNRNIFKKSYNRRPGNKGKRAAAIAEMAISSAMGAAQVACILSQPIPKFPKGGTL